MVCLLLKVLHLVCQGERARMGKMCLHGPWEIPPLFAITVSFQNSAGSVTSAKVHSRESSYYFIAKVAEGKQLYQEDQSALKWRVKSDLDYYPKNIRGCPSELVVLSRQTS